MAGALDSLPHFNCLGDDPGVSIFGRVPVNLDNVAGKMAESGDISYAPVLVDFLRMQLYYEGRTTLSLTLRSLSETKKNRTSISGTNGSSGANGWAIILRSNHPRVTLHGKGNS